MMIVASIAFLVLSARSALALDTVIDLGYTSYRGYEENGISKFKGIRYAAPPLGERRFRAPEPPLDAEAGTVEDATEFRTSCLATGDDYGQDPLSDEDCLFLNLYSPSDADEDSKLPVYIWIQGGGLQSQSNRNYDGTGLIEAGDMKMVVVNFNYRVGAFGFLSGKEVQADGDLNVGLLDQREVFKWVQKYITKFGGDPDHVTIGGASAGAGSIACHMTAYSGRNDNLFHAAAAESPSFPAQQTVEQSQYLYDYVVNATNCSSSSTYSNYTSSIACLRDLPVTTLQDANKIVPYPGDAGTPLFSWANVIDGDFTADYTYRLFREGKFINVPSIFGDDTNEGTVFAPRNTSSYDEMNAFLRSNFPKLTEDQLQTIDGYYPKAEQFNDSGEYWRTTANAYGEMRYICPGIYIDGALADAGPATSAPATSKRSRILPRQYNTSTSTSWNYRYDVHDPKNYANGLGTTHTEEVGAVWGTQYIGGTAPGSYNSTNAAIVPVVQGYWASFIRSFDPNTFRAEGTPYWTPFNTDDMPRILLNTTGTAMESVPEDQRERCRYLSGIGDSIQQRVGDISEEKVLGEARNEPPA